MILSIGEVLFDFIGIKQEKCMAYESYIGGAPFNLACGIKKLEGNVGFIGRAGKDLLGKNLLIEASKIKLDYLQIQEDINHNTTIALVNLDRNGERSFSFLRKECADYFIDVNTIDYEVFNKAKIIHIGSLMLSEKEGRECFTKIVNRIKSNQYFSFDVNYREDLFDSNLEALEVIKRTIKIAKILKFSIDELFMFTNTKSLEEAVKYFDKNQIVFITLGKDGSACFYHGLIIKAPSIKVKVVDTTGAGDAFYACILKELDESDIKKLSKKELETILYKANICGALTTTSKGAVAAFPNLETIKKYF